MRNFDLEIHFSKWEFKAKYHMTASDVESMSLAELMGMAIFKEKSDFENQWLGYTETWGADDLIQNIAETYDTMRPQNPLFLWRRRRALRSHAGPPLKRVK